MDRFQAFRSHGTQITVGGGPVRPPLVVLLLIPRSGPVQPASGQGLPNLSAAPPSRTSAGLLLFLTGGAAT
jgi:hypothetical protein